MRKLSELGISPAPWRVVPYGESTESKQPTVGDVVDATGESLVLDMPTYRDAVLMAAAPKMHEAAWKTDAVLTRLFETDEFAALLSSGAAAALIACSDLLRAALAEAAGEEVSDDD